MSGIRAKLEGNGGDHVVRVDRYEGAIPRVIVLRGYDDVWRVYILQGDPYADTDGTAEYQQVEHTEVQWMFAP